jgi:hypothetical protein
MLLYSYTHRMLLLREERMREDLERFLMEAEDRNNWVCMYVYVY